MAHGDDLRFDIKTLGPQWGIGNTSVVLVQATFLWIVFTFERHARASPLNIHEEFFAETLPDMHLDPG